MTGSCLGFIHARHAEEKEEICISCTTVQRACACVCVCNKSLSSKNIGRSTCLPWLSSLMFFIEFRFCLGCGIPCRSACVVACALGGGCACDREAAWWFRLLLCWGSRSQSNRLSNLSHSATQGTEQNSGRGPVLVVRQRRLEEDGGPVWHCFWHAMTDSTRRNTQNWKHTTVHRSISRMNDHYRYPERKNKSLNNCLKYA